jgi:starvation-inducible DNA-binding protein
MATEDDLFDELKKIQQKLKPSEAPEGVEELVKTLSVLLADTYSVYHEAHGLHWNVKGQDFAQYHELFGKIAEDIYGSVDHIAENILKLGYDSPFHMSQLAAIRTIKEMELADNDSPAAMSLALLSGINQLIAALKNAFIVADKANEQGIADFISGRIESTQKWAWQLRASLGMQKPNKL